GQSCMGKQVGFWNQGAAEFLHNRLVEKGLRVEDFAEKLGVEPRTVRNWTRTDRRPNRPSVENVPNMCKFLGVSLRDFQAAADEYRRMVEGARHQQPFDDSAFAPIPADDLVHEDETDSAASVDERAQAREADPHWENAADVGFT